MRYVTFATVALLAMTAHSAFAQTPSGVNPATGARPGHEPGVGESLPRSDKSSVSANFDARGGECLRLERNAALRRAWIVALRSCFRASAGVVVRRAFSEVERHQILDVVIWRAQR